MVDLATTSALAHVTNSVSVGAGLAMREDPALRIIHLFDKREDPTFRQRVAQTFGVDVPTKPNTVAVGSASLAWIAPGQWLALGGTAPAQDGIDVSDAYCGIRLAGPRAAELLAKSVPVDLAATAFPPQTCTRTLLGSMPLFLMHDKDGFLVLVERSLAHAAWSWLADGAQALSR
jgi:sarcosine oxidase, subunit gamma